MIYRRGRRVRHGVNMFLRAGRKGLTPNFELRTLNSPGFTLLEVMVAVAIMATVLVTLIGLKNRSMQDVLLAEHMTTATMLAKRKMVDTIISKNFKPVEEDGDFSDEEDLKDKEDFKDYSWKKTISRIPLSESSFITDVRIAVLWKEGTRQEMVELVSYELQ